MPSVGDIVAIYAPVAGYEKYHLCIKIGIDGAAHQFLYINSDPNFEDNYVVQCGRLPFLPASPTGLSCFSFTMVPRYTDKHLALYRAKVLGQIDKVLAAELLEFLKTVRGLNSSEREAVRTALTSII